MVRGFLHIIIKKFVVAYIELASSNGWQKGHFNQIFVASNARELSAEIWVERRASKGVQVPGQFALREADCAQGL